MPTAIPYANGLYAGPQNQNYDGNPTLVPYGQGLATEGTYDTTDGTGAGSPSAAETDFNTQKGRTLNSINDSIGDTADSYKSGILDYLDSRKSQQNNINSEGVQNELAREEGAQNINDMVGNGIKSGGVILSNGNSGSSSAAEALARAYGTLGRQQLSSVGNQFAQGQNKIAAEEDSLTAGDATQIRHSQDKTATINGIVNNATQALTALNNAAATANITDRVDIDKQIATVKQQALDQLTQYDALLTNGIAGQGPQSAADTRAAANKLLTAGTAPESAFNYTSEVPAQFQGSGQFASSLPIFTKNKTAVA